MDYNTKTDLVIYKTTNYDQFHFFRSNRKITKNSALESEILKSNKLKYCPILVTSDLYVIDGQHRLEIARKHGLTIYFMIDNEGVEQDLKMLQSGKRWKQEDFIHHHATIGNDAYRFLQDMVAKYGISVSAFLMCFSKDKWHGSSINMLRSGDLQIKESKEMIAYILEQYVEVRRAVCKIIRENKIHREFEIALIDIIRMPRYDQDRFLHALNKHPDHVCETYEFRTRTRIRERLIKDVYNNKIKRKSLRLVA